MPASTHGLANADRSGDERHGHVPAFGYSPRCNLAHGDAFCRANCADYRADDCPYP